jgi:hypothetical protein
MSRLAKLTASRHKRRCRPPCRGFPHLRCAMTLEFTATPKGRDLWSRLAEIRKTDCPPGPPRPPMPDRGRTSDGWRPRPQARHVLGGPQGGHRSGWRHLDRVVRLWAQTTHEAGPVTQAAQPRRNQASPRRSTRGPRDQPGGPRPMRRRLRAKPGRHSAPPLPRASTLFYPFPLGVASLRDTDVCV